MVEVKTPKPLPERKPDGHKGDFGRVLVVAGSPGLSGAAVLASEAALLTGCGLVRLVCPKSLNPVFEMKMTSVMTLPAPETQNGALSEKAFSLIRREAERFDVLVVGCGLATAMPTRRLVQDIIRKIPKPLLLDADGLNAIAGEPQILLDHTAPLIVTPHPGEMARLVAKSTEKVQEKRVEIASNFARAFKCVTVLKGYQTVVTDGRRTYVNETGNSGMATAGSGDVLSGIIGSLLAQGMSAFDAAVTGVFLHGLAGDISADNLTEYSVTAESLLDAIPEAIAQFLSSGGKKDGKKKGSSS